MLKRRDPVAIESVGQFLEDSLNDLTEQYLMLTKHIQEIDNYYQGVDSKIITSKLLEAVSKMKTMTLNIEYYSKYMKILANHDKDNLKLSINNLQTTLNEMTFNSITNLAINKLDKEV